MTMKRKIKEEKIPVTLLGGFLGAGKSTLLRHILETKHADDNDDFKCAVIVNDMAELNIDKNLIESTGLIQSEEVVSMQNGCICCSLSSDLVEQILNLTKQSSFNYMIIEASGVSEPAAIAALFAECDEDHDHDAEHKDSIANVARLDTVVTVVDSAEFLQNLDLMVAQDGDDDDKKNFPQLLVEQIEYSNIILLNKTDLVDETQLKQVQEKASLLNGKAKIITCKHSSIDVMQVLNTGLFNADDFDLTRFVEQFEKEEKPKSCCKAAMSRGESPCCLRARTLDSGKSQVLLPSKKNRKTRHGEQYHITSFVYKARRPFRPSRFYENFLTKFFSLIEDEKEDEDSEEEAEQVQEGHPETIEEDGTGGDQNSLENKATLEKEYAIKRLQEEGAEKKRARIEELGSVLRVKGFMWQATSHDLIGFVSTAGNMAQFESPGPWNVLDKKAWNGTEAEKAKLRHNWIDPWGDRRQELVFIGQDLKHKAIQKMLDSCLLTDDEMALGVDGWKATMGDVFLTEE